MDRHVIATNDESESEWEYEYDATETEDCYFTLDLTTHVPSAVEEKQYAKNGKRVPPAHKAKGKDAEARQQPEEEVQTANDTATTGPDTPANTFQLIGLHTPTPYIKFNSDFYACHWHTDLGTALYLSKPGVINSPRHAGHILDVLATSQARLVGIPANLKRKRDSYSSSGREIRPAGDNATHAINVDDGRSADGDVDLGIHTGPGSKTPLKIMDVPDDPHLRGQVSFMERLSALKMRKGEKDALKVPLAMPKYYNGASNPLELREVARAKDRERGPVPEIVTGPRGAAGSRRVEEQGWGRKSKRNPRDLIVSDAEDAADDAGDAARGAEEGDAPVPRKEPTELEAAMAKAREMQQGHKKLSRGFKGGAPTKASLRAGLGLGTSGVPRRRGRPTNAERARRAAEEEAVRKARVAEKEGGGAGGDGVGQEVQAGQQQGQTGQTGVISMADAGEPDPLVAQAYPVLAQAGRTSNTPDAGREASAASQQGGGSPAAESTQQSPLTASAQGQKARRSPSDAPPPKKARKVSFAPGMSPDQPHSDDYYNDGDHMSLDGEEQRSDDEDDYASDDQDQGQDQDYTGPDIHPSTTRRLSIPSTKKPYTPDPSALPSNLATNRRRATAADATGAAAPHPSTPASAPDIDPTTGRPIWRRRNKTQMAEYRAQDLDAKGLHEAAEEVRRKEVERQENLKVNVDRKEKERTERRLRERWEARSRGEGGEEGEMPEGKRLRGWWGKKEKERLAEEEERRREKVRERVRGAGEQGREIRWRLENDGGNAEAEGSGEVQGGAEVESAALGEETEHPAGSQEAGQASGDVEADTPEREGGEAEDRE